jgi:hypothetical protein
LRASQHLRACASNDLGGRLSLICQAGFHRRIFRIYGNRDQLRASDHRAFKQIEVC